MKKVLIGCYYGEVFIKTPIGSTRRKVKEMVRAYYQELYNKPIIDLPDFTYETESEWAKRKIKDIDKGKEFMWDHIPTIEI